MKIHPSFLIYRDDRFYSSFPAVAACSANDIHVVFRRCPSYYGYPGIDPDTFRCHHDVTSQLMYTRSGDAGKSWSEPETLFAPYNGGSQDGGLYFDGKYLFANSFIWEHIPHFMENNLKEYGFDRHLAAFGKNTSAALPGGVYLLRSDDRGKSWQGPYQPDPLPDGTEYFPGHPRLMHNRGNLVRGNDGGLYWVGERFEHSPELYADIMLYRSEDNGRSFQYFATAADSLGRDIYEEPFMCITPAGKYVILIRSQRCLPDGSLSRADLVTVESVDGGKTWSDPVRHDIHAEPSAAQRLPDGRTMIVYGYRKEPFGIRGRIVSPEFEDLDTTEEFIIRDDSPEIDTGYPWLTVLDNKRLLVVYYIKTGAVRCAGGIEGNIIEL
ncbi:MAG: exo-alpha-sialidase [Lentisphaeria bacterium]|nr:exo-alpha-sialidase [Lentisphaeria bacterium]